MSEIPDDIMDTARDLARNAGWSTSGDVRDISHALHAERQRSDSLKALCDEMAKALERLAELTPRAANAATANDLHFTVSAIAVTALEDYRNATEARNG